MNNSNTVKNILKLLRGAIDSADIEANIMEFITGKLEFPKVIMQNNPCLTSYKIFKITLHSWVKDNDFSKDHKIKNDHIIQFIGDKNGLEPYDYPTNIVEWFKDIPKIHDKFYFGNQLITNDKSFYKCDLDNITEFKVIESLALFVDKFELVASDLAEDRDKIPSEKRVSYVLNDLAVKLDPKNSQDYEDSDDEESDEEDAEIDAYYEEQYLNSLANPGPIITQEMADAIYGDDEILPVSFR